MTSQSLSSVSQSVYNSRVERCTSLLPQHLTQHEIGKKILVRLHDTVNVFCVVYESYSQYLTQSLITENEILAPSYCLQINYLFLFITLVTLPFVFRKKETCSLLLWQTHEGRYCVRQCRFFNSNGWEKVHWGAICHGVTETIIGHKTNNKTNTPE